MLDDRDYMRGSAYRRAWSLTNVLLVVTIAIYVVQWLVDRFAPQFPFEEYFALSTYGIEHFRFWQLITFQFLHGGIFHLLFNMIGLYCFGRAMEETIGARSMVRLYFFSGIFGGICQIVAGFLLPNAFGGAVVGASAGVFGLVAAFATIFPHRVLHMIIYFIPVAMKARTLLWLSIGLALLGLFGMAPGVAHLAHLGGILAGCLFIKFDLQAERPLFDWARLKLRRRPSLVKVAAAKPQAWVSAKAEPEEELPSDEFISREVDPILDKISAHGIHSLTERERKILERARSKMARR